MTDFLQLDKTGTLPANKITDIILVGDNGKTFPLDRGSFFTDSVKVWNRATSTLLQRKVDYDLVETDVEAVRETGGKSVAKYLTILKSVHIDISVEYQAVGGVYQFTNSKRLSDAVNEFVTLPENTKIVGVPDQWKSARHVQHINDFYKHGPLKAAVNRIEDAIRAGGSKSLIDAMLVYTDTLATNLAAELDVQVEMFNDDLVTLRNRTTFRDGRYYLTDIETNPSQTKGGNWSKETNTLLYGAIDNNDVGQYVDVGNAVGKIATLTNFWRKNDTGTGATYTLTSSATTVDEGGTVTLTLTTNLPNGTLVPYRITGIQAADITGPLTGNFVIGQGGIGQLVITTKTDRLSEEIEAMKVSLTQSPTNYVNITINDTSKTPYYAVKYTTDYEGYNLVTDVNEGTNFYIHVEGSELQEGERLYLHTEGSSITPSDFDSTFPQYLDIHNGSATLFVSVKEDLITESGEFLVVSISTTNDLSNIVASSTLRINDTSLGAVYRSRFVANADGSGQSLTQVNEGTVVYLVIDGDWLIEGTNLTLSYGGTAGAADFNSTRPTSAVIQGGKAIVQYSLKNDQATEGNEVFTVFVAAAGSNVTTASVTVLDTSITIGYDVYFSSSSTGADRISQVSEGGTCFLIVKTVGVANGTVLGLGYSGSVNSDDFVNARASNVTINGNVGYVQYQIKQDRDTDGNESFVVTVSAGTTTPTASITVLDTSQAPTASAFWSSNAAGTSPVLQVLEGNSVWLIIDTVGINNGERLTLLESGYSTTNLLDYTTPNTPYAVVQNNRAVREYKILADNSIEGTEVLTVQVQYNEISIRVLLSASINVVDTTQRISTYLVDVNKTEANEGDEIVFTLTTTNVYAGAPFDWVLNGTVSSQDYTPSVTSGTLTIGNDGKATYAITLAQDLSLGEGNETINMVVKHTNGTVLATSPPVTIRDTSIAVPTYALTVNTTSVNEGQSVIFTFQTTAVPAGTEFSWVLNGTAATSLDFTPNELSGSFTVNAPGQALYYSITANEDLSITEGNETLFMTVYSADDTLVATSPTITINDTSAKGILDFTYTDLFNVIDFDNFNNIDPDTGETIYVGESLLGLFSYMGIDINRYYRINIYVPNGMKIGGCNTVNGIYYDYTNLNIGAGMYFSGEFSAVPEINIYVDGWVFGTGGTRATNAHSNVPSGIHGRPALVNNSLTHINVYVGPTGWICGGGGAGGGGAAQSGGGAPYGQGLNGGGAAKLTTGGPNNGGNVGRYGNGTDGGSPGSVSLGGFTFHNNGGRLGPI